MITSYFSGGIVLDGLDILNEAHITMIDNAIADDRIVFTVQGISAVDDPAQILYSESFACVIHPQGTIHHEPQFVPYLESLGTAPSLARHMLKLILDELENDPFAILGCNLPATNMSGAGDWAGIYDQIAARPHLASRLVLEITQAAPVASAITADYFLAEAKKLGCKVAVDDFGTGYFSLGHLCEIDADIVKIDALLIGDLRNRTKSNGGLCHIVGLAGCIAPIVVIKGIKTAGQFDVAKASGASHVQGYLRSKPGLPYFPVKQTR